MASNGPEALPLNLTPNVRVLGGTLVASLLSALIFGTAPALRGQDRTELFAQRWKGRRARRVAEPIQQSVGRRASIRWLRYARSRKHRDFFFRVRYVVALQPGTNIA